MKQSIHETKKVNVITFHRLVFKKHENWEDVKYSDFEEIISIITTKKNSSKYEVVITFDDGNASDYLLAFPILRRLNIRCIFFVITSLIGEPGYLSWDNLREMNAAGMIIGSHSHTHKDMRQLSINETIYEMTQSKNILEKNLGIDVVNFSFPYGFCNLALKNLAKNCGYLHIYDSKSGLNQRDSMFMKRNSINCTMTVNSMLNTVYPGLWSRSLWMLWGYFKMVAKATLGVTIYRNLRNSILGRRGGL